MTDSTGSKISDPVKIFKLLGLEHKEDREKFTFGADTLEDVQDSMFQTVHSIKYPPGYQDTED